MKHKCVKAFSVPYLDENGWPDESGKRMNVEEGSIWETDEEDEMSEVHIEFGDIRLWRIPCNGDWIEITFGQLENNFEEAVK